MGFYTITSQQLVKKVVSPCCSFFAQRLLEVIKTKYLSCCPADNQRGWRFSCGPWRASSLSAVRVTRMAKPRHHSLGPAAQREPQQVPSHSGGQVIIYFGRDSAGGRCMALPTPHPSQQEKVWRSLAISHSDVLFGEMAQQRGVQAKGATWAP